MYSGFDYNFHLYRLHGIVTGLQDGQIYTKIYPYINNSYGYATPLFYCDLFLYPFAFLYWLGVPIVLCTKIMVIFYVFLALLFVFIASSKIFKKYKFAPYISIIIYGFCNYYLYDLYIRAAFGEIIAFAFIPLVVLSMYYVFVERKNEWFLLGLSFALLLLSHNISFILYCIFFLISLIIFCIYYRKEKNIFLSTLNTIVKGVLLAIGLSAFFLLPMLEQVYSDTFIVELYESKYILTNGAIEIINKLRYPFVYFSVWYANLNYVNLNYIYYFLQFIYIYICYFRKKAIDG